MNAETRTLVRSALDATDYTRGAAQVAQANDRMAASGDAVAGAIERQQTQLRESGGAIERLQRSLDATYRAQQQFERAQTTINAAMERGAVSQQRATELVALAQQRYLGAGSAVQALASANDNAGRASGRLGIVLGQAGFQVQDFASQVAMGQNALVAFGVQFAQFAGIFGTAGAIAGAVVTVGILTARLLGAKDAAEELKKAQEELAGAMRTANELFETQAERAARLEREQRASALQGFQNAFAQQANRVAEERRALTLLEREIAERTQANANVPGFDPERIFADRLNERRRALSVAEGEFLELNRRIEELRTRTSGADRDKAEREAQQARERAEREAEQERRRAEREAGQAARAVERERDRQEREEARARERAEREQQQARERQEREEARELERREAANRRVTDDIVKYGADAFADMFEQNGRGWSGMLANFLATFRRLMARMAAEAIIRPIISPIVSALGLGGAAGDAGGGAGAAAGIFGLSGLGSQIGSALGLGGGAFGSVGGSLANVLGTPLWGGNVAGPAFNGIAASGAPTIGGLLGGAGLGFGAGMLTNTLLGGNATGGMVGSGGGALAGAVIGSIIPGVGTALGGLLGGAAGGALGGLFGPSNTTPFWGVRVEGQDGALAITDSGGKRDNGQLNALLAATQQQMAQVNAPLAAAGISVSGARMVGSDPADPTRPGTLNDAAKFFSFSAKDSTLNRVLAGRTFETFDQLGGAATWVLNTYNAMTASTSAAEQFARQIQAVNDNFEAAIKQARDYGLETDRIAQAQRRATETLAAQREAGILSAALGQSRILGDFLAGMARGSGSPQSQFGAAQEQFAAALDVARRGGRAADLSRVTGAAQALREANAAFNGSGAAAATVEGMVRSKLANLGVSLDLPGFADNLDASINRWGEAQVDELQQVRDGVGAMREELRTLNLTIRQILAA